jgi:uncharacterized protein DUF4145
VIKFGAVDAITEPWPERLKRILSFQLPDDVPTEIRSLFEAAQATMVYGYYYYPLYTVGSEHLYRALEAALRHRAIVEGYSARQRGLKETMKYLARKGVLGERDLDRLEPLRHLRNEASHPEFQTLLTPGMAMKSLELTAREINSLVVGPSTQV